MFYVHAATRFSFSVQPMTAAFPIFIVSRTHAISWYLICLLRPPPCDPHHLRPCSTPDLLPTFFLRPLALAFSSPQYYSCASRFVEPMPPFFFFSGIPSCTPIVARNSQMYFFPPIFLRPLLHKCRLPSVAYRPTSDVSAIRHSRSGCYFRLHSAPLLTAGLGNLTGSSLFFLRRNRLSSFLPSFC